MAVKGPAMSRNRRYRDAGSNPAAGEPGRPIKLLAIADGVSTCAKAVAVSQVASVRWEYIMSLLSQPELLDAPGLHRF